jgi:uncharacterized protein
MYLFGYGVAQDYNEAVKWFQLAADQGFAWGQFNLGRMYNNGQGVVKNYMQAYEWFSLAATNYPQSSTADVEWAIESRDDALNHLTHDEISKAQSFAKEWISSHPKSQ